jgi:hypothetical protein
MARRADGHAAAHTENLAGDETAARVEQEGDGVRDIVGRADAANRDRVDNRLGAGLPDGLA